MRRKVTGGGDTLEWVGGAVVVVAGWGLGRLARPARSRSFPSETLDSLEETRPALASSISV